MITEMQEEQNAYITFAFAPTTVKTWKPMSTNVLSVYSAHICIHPHYLDDLHAHSVQFSSTAACSHSPGSTRSIVDIAASEPRRYDDDVINQTNDV
jgi:hypothetical protein